MANQRGVIFGKQFKARRVMREPAYIFDGAAHQTFWLTDKPAMQLPADRLDEAEHQKFRGSGFEKR